MEFFRNSEDKEVPSEHKYWLKAVNGLLSNPGCLLAGTSGEGSVKRDH